MKHDRKEHDRKRGLIVASVGVAALLACRAEPTRAVETAGPAGPSSAPAAKHSSDQPGPQAPAAARQAEAATAETLHAAHSSALDWLARQQAADGSWSGQHATGINTAGLTGIALLALQSDGSTPSSGRHAQRVARGVHWLMLAQDPKTGLIGERSSFASHYEHAIATQALCLALRGAPSDELKAVAQAAVDYVGRARNPYGAWRYTYPPTGESDTSVTGWMVQALVAAREAGLTIDEQALAGAVTWVGEVTDPTSGRVGYDTVGSTSSRVPGLNDQFPTDRTEAMTASGLLTRMEAGEKFADVPMLARHAGLLRTKPPEWDESAHTIDEYYWYFGSRAMQRVGGADAEAWKVALAATLLPSQAKDGEARGSWRGVGPWTHANGSTLATALNALSLATLK